MNVLEEPAEAIAGSDVSAWSCSCSELVTWTFLCVLEGNTHTTYVQPCCTFCGCQGFLEFVKEDSKEDIETDDADRAPHILRCLASILRRPGPNKLETLMQAHGCHERA